jgi:hypothetical protein
MSDDMMKEIHAITLNLAIIKQKQEDNHEDNKADIKILFDKVQKLDDLPCEGHKEKFRSYDKTKDLLHGTMASVVLCAVGFAVAWGTLKTTVKNHIDTTTTSLEHLGGEIDTHRTHKEAQ